MNDDDPIALALRHWLRYSGLRDVELDARLVLYVPLALAERERVAPLSVDERVLTVATATPTPTSSSSTPASRASHVELVLAPAERIAELLHAAAGRDPDGEPDAAFYRRLARHAGLPFVVLDPDARRRPGLLRGQPAGRRGC